MSQRTALFAQHEAAGAKFVDFAGWIKLKPADTLTHLAQWRAAVAARPSAEA